MTPNQVHCGRANAALAARLRGLDPAFQENSRRFVNEPPSLPDKPTAGWINQPSNLID